MKRNATNWACRFTLAMTILMITFSVNICGCQWQKIESLDVGKKLQSETNLKQSVPDDVTAQKKVRWDGNAVSIGEKDSLAFTADSFIGYVAELDSAKRNASIKDLVATYPDIALTTLQESDLSPDKQRAMQLIASMLDTTWSNRPIWQQYVADLATLPKRTKEKLDGRARFWRHLKNNQPDEALKLQLTKTLRREDGPVLRAEFHRLESIAAMMLGDHEKSIDHLTQAIQLIEQDCLWYASKLRLLLGEFYRHGGQWELWKSSWETAVTNNSRLAMAQNSIDPQFWDRAAFLRPAGMDWPDEAVNNLRGILKSWDVADTERSDRLGSDETVVWFAIAIQHLKRVEGQNAVLAFKKAEAGESNRQTIKALQLHQARGLVAAGQPGAASAILYRLVSENENTPLADRARAILGSMKLQNGSVAQGLNLIKAARSTSESWPTPERLRVQADYALALLMRGRESAGLEELDLAESEFEKSGQFEQLRQCLWNRAKYFEKIGQSDQQRQVSQRLAELETQLY